MNTNKLILISFACGLAASAGCGGTTPTASGVFPAQGFTGRSLRVEISGDATSWKTGASVSFGAGVTVNSVTVASPTDLFAEITVDAAADAGMRDVTVTSGGSFTLKQAFELVAPVEVVFMGPVAQGSVASFKIINHDFDNPFDTTSSSDPATGATTYPNLAVTAPSGMDLNSPATGGFTPSAYEIDGLALIDTDAAASGTISVSSGATPNTITSVTTSVAIAARTATALTLGTATSGSIGAAYDSQLFSLPAAAGSPELARIDLTTQSQTGQPNAAILGPSGHWSDLLAVGSSSHGIIPSAGAAYVIAFDLSGASNYSFNIVGHSDTLLVTADSATAHNSIATATNEAAIPFIVTPGTIGGTAPTDEDDYKFTTSAGDAGKKFHVTTFDSPDPLTDFTVDVQTATGQSISGGPQEATCDFFTGLCGVEFDTSALAASTTYYFKVAAGPNFDPTDSQYAVLVWLQ